MTAPLHMPDSDDGAESLSLPVSVAPACSPPSSTLVPSSSSSPSSPPPRVTSFPSVPSPVFSIIVLYVPSSFPPMLSVLGPSVTSFLSSTMTVSPPFSPSTVLSKSSSPWITVNRSANGELNRFGGGRGDMK